MLFFFLTIAARFNMAYRRNRDDIELFLGFYTGLTLVLFIFIVIFQVSSVVDRFWQSMYDLLLVGLLVTQFCITAYLQIVCKLKDKREVDVLEVVFTLGLTTILLIGALSLLYFNQKRI